jgi:hypothetical protein
MKNIRIGSVFTSIGHQLARFHMTLFIVFIAGALTLAVLFLNNMLSDTSASDNYTSPIDAGSIDQTTLDRIKELHTSDEAVPDATLPGGRVNPFGE